MDPKAQMKHAERFLRYMPILDSQFDNPKSSARKLSDRKESQISKVFLTGWKRMIRKAGNRLPSRIPMHRKRYRASYFSVPRYRAWLIDARETVGISCFRPTKKIILWWSHVVVSVLWINKAKWTKSSPHCISISRLNALKNTHGVCMMYTTKPSLFRKLRSEEVKVSLEETGMDVSNNQE